VVAVVRRQACKESQEVPLNNKDTAWAVEAVAVEVMQETVEAQETQATQEMQAHQPHLIAPPSLQVVLTQSW
jgi:hypothetical protein